MKTKKQKVVKKPTKLEIKDSGLKNHIDKLYFNQFEMMQKINEIIDYL